MQPQLLTVIDKEVLKTWTTEEWAKWWIEPKRDGYRLTYHKGQFLSRTGKPFHNLEHIAAELSQIPGVTFDGELYGDHWEDAAAARRSKNGSANELRFAVFDILHDTEWVAMQGLYPLHMRRAKLVELLNKIAGRKHTTLMTHTRVTGFDAFYNLHRLHLASGCDGTVLKRFDSRYEFKRTKTWLKVKPVETIDGKVTGLYAGKGKHEGRAGGVVFVPEGSTVETRVGTGFSDEQREVYWNNSSLVVGKTIEVAARGVHKSGALIEPRFIRLREDK